MRLAAPMFTTVVVLATCYISVISPACSLLTFSYLSVGLIEKKSSSQLVLKPNSLLSNETLRRSIAQLHQTMRIINHQLNAWIMQPICLQITAWHSSAKPTRPNSHRSTPNMLSAPCCLSYLLTRTTSIVQHNVIFWLVSNLNQHNMSDTAT